MVIGGLVGTLLLMVAVLVGQSRLRGRLEQWGQGQERLETLLREQERTLFRQLSGAHQVQMRQAGETEQRLLVRFSRLYQALERRFGEMQKHSSDDAGRLRSDLVERFDALERVTGESLSVGRLAQQRGLSELAQSVSESLARQRESFDGRQQEALQGLQLGFASATDSLGQQLTRALESSAEQLSGRVRELTDLTERRLKEIGGQVERRLDEGFEKTTETFTRVLSHLSRIDEAQKRITELSSNVVSLQEVLADKRSRGAFGEVQLASLVRNVLPETAFALQHSLSNGTRVDCLLRMPGSGGDLAVDAKFPLEGYRRAVAADLSETERSRAVAGFRQDVQRHIRAIAQKYILPGETAEGAVMFVPAEAVFAEIHGRLPDLVEQAHRQRVWIVSPTTMMAVLTTARAVLRDEATREQVHVIQRHLGELSKDFGRFQGRMDRLAQHIHQAQRDVDEVNSSARRISGRFEKIERVELEGPPRAVEAQSRPATELTAKGSRGNMRQL